MHYCQSKICTLCIKLDLFVTKYFFKQIIFLELNKPIYTKSDIYDPSFPSFWSCCSHILKGFCYKNIKKVPATNVFLFTLLKILIRTLPDNRKMLKHFKNDWSWYFLFVFRHLGSQIILEPLGRKYGISRYQIFPQIFW